MDIDYKSIGIGGVIGLLVGYVLWKRPAGKPLFTLPASWGGGTVVVEGGSMSDPLLTARARTKALYPHLGDPLLTARARTKALYPHLGSVMGRRAYPGSGPADNWFGRNKAMAIMQALK